MSEWRLKSELPSQWDMLLDINTQILHADINVLHKKEKIARNLGLSTRICFHRLTNNATTHKYIYFL